MKKVLPIIGAAFLCFAAYASSFVNDFGVHNDYLSRVDPVFVFDPTSLKGMLQHFESMHLLYIGRPLNAILFNFQQSFLQTAQDYATWRLISFFTLLAIAGALYFYLRKTLRTNPAQMAVIAIGLLFLPSSALYINWIANYVPGPLNIMVAFGGWLLFDRAVSAQRTAAKIGFGSASFVVLIASCLIYPATTLFFLFVPLVRVLYDRREWRLVRNEAVAAIVCMVFILLSYYVIHKKLLFPYFQDYFGKAFKSYDPVTYKFKFTLNTNFISLIWDAVNTGLSLFSIALKNYLAFTVNLFVVVFAGIASYALPPVRSKETAEEKNAVITQKLLVVVAIFGLALSPVLMSSKGFIAYRVLFAFYVMVLVVVVRSYSIMVDAARLYVNVKKKYIMHGFLAVAIALGVMNNNALVANSKNELDFFREEFRKLHPLLKNAEKPTDIYVIMPERYKPFIKYQLPLDLTYNATNYSGLMWGLIHLLAEEQGINRERYKINKLNMEYRSDYMLPEDIRSRADCLVIDVRDLNKRIAN